MITCWDWRARTAGGSFPRLIDRASTVRAIDEVMLPGDTTGTSLPIRMADDDRKRKNDQGGPGTSVITKTRPQTKRPNLYRVLILNDDYTPMEFVVHVLERFFGRDRSEE